MVATGGELTYNFEAIDAHLDVLDGKKALLVTKKEGLQTQMTRWTGFWDGDTKENAQIFTTSVITTLENTIDALGAYIAKARAANMDMRTQELQNAAVW